MTATWLASPHLLAVNLLNPTSLLSALGALAVLIVLFCETGLLLGFFLPGDSLLFTAGVLCATTSKSGLHLSLWATLAAGAVGALAGAQVGTCSAQRPAGRCWKGPAARGCGPP